MPEPRSPLRRSRRRRLLAGICGGVATWLGISPLIVRILWLAITVVPVLPGLPLYLIMWLVVPFEEPDITASSHESSETIRALPS